VESESKATIELARLAKTLDSHKLSLNRSKTRVFSADEFITVAEKKSVSDPINSIEKRFLDIVSEHIDDPYDNLDIDELDDADREELYGLALDEVLKEYLKAKPVDYSRIGWFLRRLSQVGIPGSAKFIVQNMNALLPVISDVARYLSRIGITGYEAAELGELLAEGLENEVVAQSEYLSACILSSFANSPGLNNFNDIERLYSGSPMVKRKIVLAAEAQGKPDWIRGVKRDFSSSDIWLKRAMVYACRILPRDESRIYIKHLKKPFEKDFLFTLVANEALNFIK